MARSDRTSAEVKSVADTLGRIAETLRHVAARMEENDLPSILIHWDTQTKHHIPMLAEWSGRLRGEVESQIEAFKLGVLSRAERVKRSVDAEKARTQKRELEARKPKPKKGT